MMKMIKSTNVQKCAKKLKQPDLVAYYQQNCENEIWFIW